MADNLDKILEKPVLLLAPRTMPDLRIPSESFDQKELEKFTALYDLLSGEGYDVKVLGSTEENGWTKKYWKLVNSFEETHPGSVIRIDVDSKSDYNATIWPRDIFQVYGDLVLSDPHCEDITKQILEQLNVDLSKVTLGSSDAGVGGCIVRDGNLLIISGALSTSISVSPLQDRGYELTYFPPPKKDGDGSSFIDASVNLIVSSSGTPIIYVDKNYCESFPSMHIDDIADDFNAILYTIPRKSPDITNSALNFVKLPDGRVVMPNENPKLKRYLKIDVGKHNVVIAEPDIVSGDSGGSLRAMTNLIE